MPEKEQSNMLNDQLEKIWSKIQISSNKRRK